MSTNNPNDSDRCPIQTQAEYPELFIRFVMNSVQATLESIDPDASFLDEEVRERAKHVLSFALKVEKAWSATKALILCIALKMEQAGHRDDWIPYLEQGVACSQEQNDRQTEAELRLYIGELLRLRSKFALARQWLDTSIAIFAELSESHGQARAMNQLAFVAWQQHRYDETEELAKSALALLDKTDPECATCFSRLGAVAVERKQWKEAEEYHRDALQIRQTQSDQRKIAWSLQNLGSALRGQGEYKEAIDCYERAILILEELQDLINRAIAQMNLAITNDLYNQKRKALELYALAEPVFRKFHDQFYLAKIFVNKGLCYFTIQEWQQAEYAFLASANLFQMLGDTGENLNAMDGLGLVYLQQDQYDKAGTIFQSALTKLPQIAGTPMYNHLAAVLPVHLAQASEKAGNAQNSSGHDQS